MDLDELQRETEKLLLLLVDRQQGTVSWHMFLRDRLTAIKALITAAGI
jgi:hypothetical protein